MKKTILLISSCLCGTLCRYDGNHNRIDELEQLSSLYTLILVCPEELGGLSTPRDPAERKGDRIITCTGIDVTEAFIKGAKETLHKATENECTVALLKAKSPSCGKGLIYDGTFTKHLVPGDGITASLLKEHNIAIYTEEEIPLLLKDTIGNKKSDE